MSRTIGQYIQLQYRRVFEVHSSLFSSNNARVLKRGAHFPRDRFGPPLRIVTSCTSLQSKSKFATYLTVNINGCYIDTYTCYIVHRRGRVMFSAGKYPAAPAAPLPENVSQIFSQEIFSYFAGNFCHLCQNCVLQRLKFTTTMSKITFS